MDSFMLGTPMDGPPAPRRRATAHNISNPVSSNQYGSSSSLSSMSSNSGRQQQQQQYQYDHGRSGSYSQQQDQYYSGNSATSNSGGSTMVNNSTVSGSSSSITSGSTATTTTTTKESVNLLPAKVGIGMLSAGALGGGMGMGMGMMGLEIAMSGKYPPPPATAATTSATPSSGRKQSDSSSLPLNASATTDSSGIGLPVPIRNPTTPTSSSQPVSLFATCMNLIEKLYSFPLFEFYLFPDGWEQYTQPDSPMMDPVAVLWNAFRLGAPLCMIYNQLSPNQSPLNVGDVSGIRVGEYKKVCKDNVYHFILACRNELNLAEAGDFSISELYKDETHGFMKVLKLVQVIVARIEANGLMPPKKKFPIDIPSTSLSPTDAPLDNRSKVIKELVDTERIYIQSLELLNNYQKEVVKEKLLSKEQVFGIFSNLSDLLDFQRRFMVAMEATLTFAPGEQRIGLLFLQNEDAFSVYHPFCANYQYATNIVLEEMETLKKLSHIIEPIQLQSYLIKPVQRVCKYPLLINELIKLSDSQKHPYLDELKEGLEAIKRITEKVNEESRKAENEALKNDLADRVEDWKGLNLKTFGDLILSDKLLLSTTDQEREYNLFLFEKILLCCKDLQKPRKKKRGDVKDTGTTYSLKGNIYISAIYSVMDISDPDIGFFAIKVEWKDGTDKVSFTVKCRTPEQVKLWKDRIERLTGTGEGGKRKQSTDATSVHSNGGGSIGPGVGGVNMPPVPQVPLYGRAGSRDDGDGFYGGGIQMGRSRSIPNANAYGPPQQSPKFGPMQGGDGNVNAYMMMQQQQQQQQQQGQQQGGQRISQQLVMNRGYGSAVDLYQQQQQMQQQQNPTSSSPTPGMYASHNRGISPPPVPYLPSQLGGGQAPAGYGRVVHGHSRLNSDSSAININNRQPPVRGDSYASLNGQNGYPVPINPLRHGSGQGGVNTNMPPPPMRSYSINDQNNSSISAVQAAIAAAASGSVPLAGYSDDEFSDDEEDMLPRRVNTQTQRGYPNQQQQQQQGQRPPSANAIYPNNSPQQQRAMPQQRMQRQPSQDDGSSGAPSPTTPVNPFAPSAPWRSNSISNNGNINGGNGGNVPPVPAIPAGYQQQGLPKRTPSINEGNRYTGPNNGYPASPMSTTGGQQGPNSNFLNGRPGPPRNGSVGGPGPYIPNSNNYQQQQPQQQQQRDDGGLQQQQQQTQLNQQQQNQQIQTPNMKRAPTAPLPQPIGTTSTDPLPPPVPASLNLPSTGFIKVKTHYENDVFVIAIPARGAAFGELVTRIERKIRLCGGRSPGDQGRVMRMRYRRGEVVTGGEEGGDGWVEVLSDEDVAVAFDLARFGKEKGVLNLFVL
ncbi:hypothetical protein HDU76_005434 [Blyttiomyces sp. JEL0837]|nr:hypothetical protein HDU76_005434 [Blyttiomyces sp. JEL0837]